MVGGMTFFLATPIAFLLLSRRMRRHRQWMDLAPYAVVAGVVLIGAAVGMNLLVGPTRRRSTNGRGWPSG